MPKLYIVHYEEDPEAIVQFRMHCRCLWEDHVIYVARAITSIIADMVDINAISDRLTKNAVELGSVLATYHGDGYGTQLTDLLKAHIANVVDTVGAIKAGASTTELNSKSLDHIMAVADVLSSLDPKNWPRDAVISLFTNHLACTTKQATDRVAREWVSDIAAFDECIMGIRAIADVFANGIVDKFPEKFIRYEEWRSPTAGGKLSVTGYTGSR